jgi:hypothetical protein
MSPIWQDLDGFWRHTETTELFETEQDALEDYEREIRKRT